MIYDFSKEKAMRYKKSIFLIVALLAIIVLAIAATNIYLEVIELEEMGGFSSRYLKDLVYKIATLVISFVIVFSSLFVTSKFAKKNVNRYTLTVETVKKREPTTTIISLVIALFGSMLAKNQIYMDLLNFLNTTDFDKFDPIFQKDIGYYVFQRPFFMSLYGFLASLSLFVIIYTVTYYAIALYTIYNTVKWEDFKNRYIFGHNLINISIFFIIKAFSYVFTKEDILYGSFLDVRGGGYTEVNIWLKYYTIAPVLLLVIAALTLIFIYKKKLKSAMVTVAVFPAVWVVFVLLSLVIQNFVVNPNELNLEREYLQSNIEKTREAYNLDKIIDYDFPKTKGLTSDMFEKNPGMKEKIRVVDYESTLVSNIQLQAIRNFYTFNDGDIINYNIDGEEIPVFITAREIDTNRLPDRNYLNTTYKYTHGYGVVINPVNKINSSGQVDFILNGLAMDSTDTGLVIDQPRIYYGELTSDHVIVNASNGLEEIDYDGNSNTIYQGKGGIELNLFNRFLYSLKYGDLKMLISGYAKDATLLPNRQIIERAQKATPFLEIDSDPYILINDKGGLTWVLDGYTTTNRYPYAQYYGNINYIRNSVKILIDANDGKLEYYIIDKEDPIIQTYSKIYPEIFTDEPLPEFAATHMKYPESLFIAQTQLLRRYHTKPEDITIFYSKQDLWDIAKYPANSSTGDVVDIEPYYNMVRLPGHIGQDDEFVLMRPFTPSNKHNMVSWLGVRNSAQNYGEMIMFNFPRNTNVLGPYQVEVKINQIDQISENMTLWGQDSTNVYKGSLLVIPIEDSILYVEPIYIRAAGTSSIPEIRLIVMGYQSDDEFIYGIGMNLDSALNDLFGKNVVSQQDDSSQPGDVPAKTDSKIVEEILDKYDQLKRQLEDLGQLIEKLN